MKHGDWSVNSFVTLGDIETGTVLSRFFAGL